MFGLVALMAFGYLAAIRKPARANALRPLLLQSSGTTYGEPVNERLTPIEQGCRRVLAQIGVAELDYAAENQADVYGYLQDLVLDGYVQPNATGRSFAPSYSITFYLSPARRGFTLIAEPQIAELRPLMLTENQRVVPLTPTIEGDPNDDWQTVRESQWDRFFTQGYYDFITTAELLQYDTNLQLRLNRERTEYVLLTLEETEPGLWAPDDSFLYVSAFASYMLGDTREFELEPIDLEEIPEEAG